MSLQNLATQMAAQGRGPDRTLVHMSPKEVQGLQALAMAHGGSLTINPETGLPEAGFLENILPAVAGFALNAFAPGVGTAVGSLFGLGGAAGTALTVGGIAGLTSGSLEKGIMAGMGAYGGAGLGASLQNSGTTALTKAGVDAAGGAEALGGDASSVSDTVAKASAFDKIKAGAGAAFSQPKDFLQDNKMNLALLTAPALMGTFDDKTVLPSAQATKKYNMNYVKDPVTGALYDTSGEGVTYGGVGQSTRGMAEGGIVDYDTRTDSQKAFDYLMGKGPNPMLFTHKKATGPIEPADMLTRKGGHYVLDAATNTYVWVPDDTTAADAASKAGLASLQERLGGGRGEGISTGPTGTGADAQGNVSTGFGGFTLGPDGKVTPNQTPAILGALPIIGSFFSYQNEKARQAAEAFKGAIQDTDPNFNGQPIEGSPTATAGPTGTGGQAAAAAAAAANAATAAGATPAQAAAAAQAAANAAIGGANAATSAAMGQGAMGVAQAGGDFGAVGGGFGGDGTAAGDGSGVGFGGIYARGGRIHMAGGGLGSLGGYSDGGQLLRGPGDGVSDSIPARIGRNQPARLADGEFVIPARIVSELGNGSTNAGAKQLYKMLDRIQANRKKTVGKNKTAVNSKSARYLPA